ncbi:hypothetical protein DSO57_1025204, partial [Entomophthora muscae]
REDTCVRNIPNTYSYLTNKLSPTVNVKAPAATGQTSTAIKQINTATMQKPIATKPLPTVNAQAPTATKQTSTTTARAPMATKQIHATTKLLSTTNL